MSGKPFGLFLEGTQEKASNPEADSWAGSRINLILGWEGIIHVVSLELCFSFFTLWLY